MLRYLFALALVLLPTLSFVVGPMLAVVASNEKAVPTAPVISATPGDTTNTIALTSGDVGFLTNTLYWDTTSRASYDLYANNISNVTLVAASFPGTPYVHTGRTNGTPYYYRLCGTDLAGQTCSSEVSGTPASGGSEDCTTGVTKRYCKNWESSLGNDTSETWTVAGTGTVNQAYTTTPLRGSRSALLTTTSGQWSLLYPPVFTQSTTFNAFFRVQIISDDTTAPFRDNSSVLRAAEAKVVKKMDKVIQRWNSSCLPNGKDCGFFRR